MNTNPRRRDQPVDYQDLAELLPAPSRPVLAQDRHRVLRENLMEHITHETTREQSGATTTSPTTSPNASPVIPARQSPGRRLVLVAPPLALATAVGLGVVAVDSAQDGKCDTAAAGVMADDHRKATQLLDRIALAAADRPTIKVRDDQFIYTKSQKSAGELGVDCSSPEELAKRKGTFKVEEYKGGRPARAMGFGERQAGPFEVGRRAHRPFQEDGYGHGLPRISDLQAASGSAHRSRRAAEEALR
ncbi:hypothetical protein [Streptomyces mirabilis]|uniref:hypothetical protein n=1 Tax=Streptomyces mirabilis TaxID=68239 RepID=UPI0036B254CB